MQFSFRPQIGLLLIAFIAISHTVPAGCEHAHAIANGTKLCAGHEHHHEHGTHHTHEAGKPCGFQYATSKKTAAAEQIVSVQLHTHVRWLGLEFVLVGGAVDETDSQQHEGDHTVLLLDDAPQRAELLRIEVDPPQLALGWLPVNGDAMIEIVAKQAVIVSTARPPQQFLCDAARHERSGVQLF